MRALGGATLCLVDTLDYFVRKGQVDFSGRAARLLGVESGPLEQALGHPVMAKVVYEALPPSGCEPALASVSFDESEMLEDGHVVEGGRRLDP